MNIDIVKPPTDIEIELDSRFLNDLKAQTIGLDPESTTIEVTQE